MKKLVLSVCILLVLFVFMMPALAKENPGELFTDGDYEYNVTRQGNSISLISTVPKIPRIAGIPNLVGTISGTTFSGKVYLVADDCPNLDGYVPANGTVSKDGNSLTVTYNTTDFYYTTCVEKANSESEVTKTYSIASAVNPSPTSVPITFGVRDIERFNREILDIEKVQRSIDQCPPPHIPSESACVSDALSQFGLPIYFNEIVIEPNFTDTNTLLLDDSRMQIISLPEGMKEVPDYPPNSISTNFTEYSKDFEIAVDNSDLGKLPVLNLSPMYPPKVGIPEAPYSIVESIGVSSVSISSVSKPGSNYSGDWKSLVALDVDPNSNAAIINTTGLVLDSSTQVTLLNNTNQSVMEVSNGARVVVAGWAADDTLEAAQDFVSLLAR